MLFAAWLNQSISLGISLCASMPAETADLTRQIKNLQRKLRRLKKRQALRQAVLDRVALLVYICSDHRAEVAAQFHISMSPVPSSLPSAIAHVEWLYINAPLEDKVAMMLDPLMVYTLPQALMALRYVLGFQLHEWVRMQNCDFGVAPSRQMMAEQFRQMVPKDLPPSLKAKVLTPLRTPRSQRKFLASFRKQFGCKLGRLRTASLMSVEEQQSKARACAGVG